MQADVSEALNGRANFKGLREWIAVQEAYEAATGKPAPLTAAQRKAIALLQLPPESGMEPEPGDKDWISLLQRYRDAHPGVQVQYTESGADGIRWRCHCTLTLATGGPITFPLPDSSTSDQPGTEQGQLPSFQRKKDAKKYAAMCAVEWLISQAMMPSDGVSVTFPKAVVAPQPPSQKKRKVSVSVLPDLSHSPAPPSSSVPFASLPQLRNSSNPAQQPTATMTPPAAMHVQADDGDGPDDYGDGVPPTQRVTDLCAKLNFKVPQYNLTPTAGGVVGYWDGAPDFGHEVRVPDGLGVVLCIYGKKNAKERIAELVLAWLMEVDADRNAKLAALIASRAGMAWPARS